MSSRSLVLIPLAIAACVAAPLMAKPPPPQLSTGTWILFESMSARGTDRSTNWRFKLDQDGCYRVARNSALRVDPDRVHDSDAALFWNTPFPGEAAVCLEAGERAQVQEALERAELGKLAEELGLPEGVKVNDPRLERWTVIHGEQRTTVAIESPEMAEGVGLVQGLGPWARGAERLVRLRAELQEVVSSAIERQRAP
ncbi:MAG: hypothetical protein H6741_05720 [Alphaproteobacteria bacterium]|nr:hypothetical protein [Alphaproteobacteria bacterium]MCB9792205.1 hypothetical protein [Alphaproteobacteria bacterium]